MVSVAYGLLVTGVMLGAGCGARARPAEPVASNRAVGGPATLVAVADVACSSWMDAAAACACMQAASLATDEWAEFEGDAGTDDDAAPAPAVCTAAPSRGLAFRLEGSEGYQTLWLVEGDGDRTRAVAGPLLGQVQGRRLVSDVVVGAIAPFGPAALDVTAAAYTWRRYEEFIAGEPDEEEVAYVLLCQPTAAGTACLAPIVTAVESSSLRVDDGGHEQRTERRSQQRVELGAGW
jgi:hypothetical protein